MTAARRLLPAAVLLALTVACSGVTLPPQAQPPEPRVARQVPAPPTTSPPTTSPATVTVTVTFYAGRDNTPPGSEIAHPNGRHAAAGGTGTYEDPTTLATDPRELPVGSILYYAPLQRYFVMEDDCDTCIADWGRARSAHLDLWVSSSSESAVLDCEEALTPAGPVPVEVNPPPGRPVDPRPLFDRGRCWPDT